MYMSSQYVSLIFAMVLIGMADDFHVGDTKEMIVSKYAIEETGPCMFVGNVLFHCGTLEIRGEKLHLFFRDGKLSYIVYYGDAEFFGVANGTPFIEP